MASALSSRAAPPPRLCRAARRRALPRCALRVAATAPLQSLRKGAPGAGGVPIGAYVCPTLLNNCPHPREVRQHFYGELTTAVRLRGTPRARPAADAARAQVLAALKDGKTRMRSFQQCVARYRPFP